MNLFTVAVAVALMSLTTAMLAGPALSFYERAEQRAIIEASLDLGQRYIANHCGSLPASVTFETAVAGVDADGLGRPELSDWELRFDSGVGLLAVTFPTPLLETLLVTEFGGIAGIDEVEVPLRSAQERSPAHRRVFLSVVSGGSAC